MSDTSRQREEIIARILRESGRSGVVPRADENNAACPDAELLAAFADHSLSAIETERWESHFADCSRCQQILALLAVSSIEEPTEVFEPALVAAMPLEPQPMEPVLVASMPQRKEPVLATSRPPGAQPKRWTKFWLVPALGAAAAAALWFAMRPIAPPAETTAQVHRRTAPPQYDVATPNPADSSSAANSEVAQAELPPPPSSVPAPAAKRSASAAGLTRELDQLKEAQGAGAAATATAPQSPAVSQPAGIAGASGSGATEATGSVAAAQNDQEERSGAVGGGLSAGARPAPAPSSDATAQTATPGRNIAAFRSLAAPLAKTVAPPAPFASPDRSVLWRVGARGRIERSNDQGRTWLSQSSGVTSDLVAGAAASSQAVWVVGRAGIILRTTDGMNWQRVASPDGLIVDWMSIEAADDLHATIVSSDLRRFSTADGGRTWTQQ